MVGGNSSHQEVLKSVERYSFDDEKWSNVAPMSVPRASPAVSSVDGLLYVAGGDQVRIQIKSKVCTKLKNQNFQTREVNFYRAQITISSFECYDPLSDDWKERPSLPTSRSEAGAVVI